jgi:hypothetical protein
MRCVTVWACSCGVSYKAICETGFIPENKAEVVCPQCETVTEILGILQDVFKEVAEGEWRSVRQTAPSIGG